MPLMHGVTSTAMMLLEISVPELSTAIAPHSCMLADSNSHGCFAVFTSSREVVGGKEKQGAATRGF